VSHYEPQVSKRYARALFEAAKQHNAIDLISEELTGIHNTIVIDNSLINFLTAPQVADEDKYSLIDNIFKNRFSDIIHGFMRLLVEKHRTRFVEPVIEEFTNLVEEEKGILRVKVTTSLPLDKRQSDELVARLRKMTGKTIHLYREINKEIIGGIVINMKNHIIDDSIKSKLDSIKNHLLSIKVH